jgi:hydroxymethylpyrimidine kinase/phosphomethylpyrimidine kinase
VTGPVALTIAGSDPSGGAGIQADLKTFMTFGVYGTAVVAALTVQDTRGVHGVAAVDPALVAEQLEAVLADLPVGGAKTGMLLRSAVVEVVAARLAARPPGALVVDPVLVATSGAPLLDDDAIAVLRTRLLPLATLVTPNLHEAAVLTGRRVADRQDVRDVARALVDLGARAALVTGGHLDGDATDVLHDGTTVHTLSAPRVPGPPPHGTGCALSAAVTAELAAGRSLEVAVETAKRWVGRAIASGRSLGRGVPVLDHFVAVD